MSFLIYVLIVQSPLSYDVRGKSYHGFLVPQRTSPFIEERVTIEPDVKGLLPCGAYTRLPEHKFMPVVSVGKQICFTVQNVYHVGNNILPEGIRQGIFLRQVRNLT